MLWSDVFSCGIPHIDAQHMGLFEHIERLGTMHGDVSRIPMTIDFLDDYTAEHFADEESLHQQTRYPRALEHSRQHKVFTDKIKKLRSDYEDSGHSLATLMDMNHALVAWLKEHILQVDKLFVQFFNPLPDEVKRAVRLPYRPWIPESSQSFYHEATGVRPKPADDAKEARTTTTVFGSSWSDTMLCGIPLIDEQHKELFRQIDALRDRSKKDRIPGVLRFLADYVVKHFNDEESLHLKSRYPQAADHRKIHENFVKTFWELKGKYDQSGGEFAAVMEINKVLFDWLKNHVLKTDIAFVKYYFSLPENGGAE
jgi:hemerythrin